MVNHLQGKINEYLRVLTLLFSNNGQNTVTQFIFQATKKCLEVIFASLYHIKKD